MKNLLKMYENASTIEEREQIMVLINMKKENMIMIKHDHKIWEGADGKYYTYIRDNAGKRKLIKRKTKSKMIDTLHDHYFSNNNCTTILSEYDDWMAYRLLTCNRDTTVHRNDADWEKYYINDEVSYKFITTDIEMLSKNDILAWLVYICKTYETTKTKFYSITLIARSIFEYLYDQEKIDHNTFADVKTPTNHFITKRKPKSITQVFTPLEEKQMITAALNRYERRGGRNIFLFAVPFLFYTGLRVGELAALQWDDIDDDYITVHQSLKACKDYVNGIWLPREPKIHHSLKKNAPPRTVPVNDKLRDILGIMRKHYERLGEDPIYVFEKEEKLISVSSIGTMFEEFCIEIGTCHKSPHKARKTFISRLIDNGIPLNTIREISGHEDERTTLQNYCFTRSSEQQILDDFNNAFA